MKIKKMLCAVLCLILCCAMLTGCMCMSSNVRINEDGSGTVQVKIGYTEDFFAFDESGAEEIQKGLESGELITFVENGTTYYGKIETDTFDNLSEFCDEKNREEEPFFIEKLINGGYRLTITMDTVQDDSEVVSEPSEDSLFGEVQMNPADLFDESMSSEMIEMMLEGMSVKFSFDFPTNVKQISGTTKGVNISGTKVTYDFIKSYRELDEAEMMKAAKEPIVLVFETEGDGSKPTQRFVDVPKVHWACTAIEYLAETGLVDGVGNNKFNPDGTLTVAQFCQILARDLKLETGAENGYWAYRAVANCVNLGFVENRGEITPKNYDVPILREEAIAGMYLAKKDTLTVVRSITKNDIPDIGNVTAKYVDDVVNAYNYGVCSGVDAKGTFNGSSRLTRAQICQLFYNVNAK